MDTLRMYLPALILAPMGMVVALSIAYWVRLGVDGLAAWAKKPGRDRPAHLPVASIEDHA